MEFIIDKEKIKSMNNIVFLYSIGGGFGNLSKIVGKKLIETYKGKVVGRIITDFFPDVVKVNKNGYISDNISYKLYSVPFGNLFGNLGSSNSGSSNLYQPSWAVSQPGNVYIYVQAPSSLNYSESSGLNYTLPLIYVNNIYTMSNSQLEVSYYVYSYALSSPYSGNFNAEPAAYNSSSDQLIPSNSTIGNIEVSLSPNLVAVPSQIPIGVEYNVSNVVTNVLIPPIILNSNRLNLLIILNSLFMNLYLKYKDNPGSSKIII